MWVYTKFDFDSRVDAHFIGLARSEQWIFCLSPASLVPVYLTPCRILINCISLCHLVVVAWTLIVLNRQQNNPWNMQNMSLSADRRGLTEITAGPGAANKHCLWISNHNSPPRPSPPSTPPYYLNHYLSLGYVWLLIIWNVRPVNKRLGALEDDVI